MKPLLLIAAAAAAVAGACSTSPLDREPTPSNVTFELRNDGVPSLFLSQNCLLDLTITSLADPVHVVEREGPCGCDCGVASCPVCGPCYAGPREIAGGAMLSEYWNAVTVTHEPAPAGSCERKHALPAGQYRIDIPVYSSSDGALTKTGGRIATQMFTLPVAGDTLSVALAVSP